MPVRPVYRSAMGVLLVSAALLAGCGSGGSEPGVRVTIIEATATAPPSPTSTSQTSATEGVDGTGGGGPALLLPDLFPFSPRDLYVEVNEAGVRELRFSTTVANSGDGPLDLAGEYEAETGRTRAIQRMLLTDGSMEEQIAGSFAIHPEHEHWHFENFTMFELWTYDPGAGLVEMLGSTGKMSFCIIDSDRFFPQPANAAEAPNLLVCDPWLQGISVGFEDTYSSKLPGQNLEIGDLADGTYGIRTLVDPDGLLRETDDTNNEQVDYIEIEGLEVRLLEDT